MKTAFITGITGQDGSYLADLLLSKGYVVHGMIRRASNFNTQRIDDVYSDPHVSKNLFLHYGDLTDSSSVDKILKDCKPDEVYNLGAQSHVKVSFDVPEYTADTVAVGALRILESLRNNAPETRFYQASSSEMFGLVQEIPQRETTPFYPRSPYGVAKLFAYWSTVNFRESYNLYACNGILFNHESPRRGRTFVTRKVTRGLARVALGLDECLYLGNMDAKRDWGHAKDYVEAMWLMLQQDKPSDYVVATGIQHSVRELVEVTAKQLGMNLVWEGEAEAEVGIDKNTNKTIVRVDPKYYRPAEVDTLLGDPTKAKTVLNWQPKYDFYSLVEEMAKFDLENEKTGKYYY